MRGRTAICSASDIDEAVAIAARLYPPAPYRRSVSKPHAPVPLKDVAAELGVSGEAVRQIEQRALRKCRAYLEQHYPGWTVEDLLAR